MIPVNVAVPISSSTARSRENLAPSEISKRKLVNVTLSLYDVTRNSYGPSTVTVVAWKMWKIEQNEQCATDSIIHTRYLVVVNRRSS